MHILDINIMYTGTTMYMYACMYEWSMEYVHISVYTTFL